jgi:glycosyltransferase involved in cell wall biosynthesis
MLDSSHPLRLLYVGSVTAEKGVADLLRSLQLLKAQGLQLELDIVGRDPDGSMGALARRLGLHDEIKFCGVIPNEDIPNIMRTRDIVVIPSRHEYPEGLPLTIYEALAARTPIIASDHPMFRGTLVNQETAVIFRAGDPGALAESIRRLAGDPELYAAISEKSSEAWSALQLPVTWGELIQRWLSDSTPDREWLANYSIASGRYNDQIAAYERATDFNLGRREAG